jgi:hypothetical protein
MATKTGILSDRNYMKNCESYKPLPIGFANANFVGNRPNPNLPGVKTVKYQRSAPRPVSADVLAVNLARMNPQGNSFKTARNIMDMYVQKGKEFRPPPVKIRSLEEDLEELHAFIFGDLYQGDIGAAMDYTNLQDFMNDYYGMLSGPRPKIYRQNRGDAILKQTISTAVQVDDIPDRNFYLAHFNGLQRTQQEQIYRNLYRVLRTEGVNVSQYQVGNQPSKGDLQSSMPRLLEIIYSRGVNIDLERAFQMISPATLGEQSQPPSVTTQTSSDIGSMVSGFFGGIGSAMSGASTQQGVAQTSTTQTTPEIEKK